MIDHGPIPDLSPQRLNNCHQLLRRVPQLHGYGLCGKLSRGLLNKQLQALALVKHFGEALS
jgi:hypothetical protein